MESLLKAVAEAPAPPSAPDDTSILKKLETESSPSAPLPSSFSVSTPTPSFSPTPPSSILDTSSGPSHQETDLTTAMTPQNQRVIYPSGVELRDITDVSAFRQAFYKKALEAIRNTPAVSNQRYKLMLTDVDYEDKDEDFSVERQKEAILKGETLKRRIRGTWVLQDANGNIVDKKRTTIMTVPHVTERGTFLVNGDEYAIASQLRLRAGIYTKFRSNGEIFSQINPQPGTGPVHTYEMEPETGIFKISIGQAKIPLYPVLRLLGVSDQEMQEAWGTAVFEANSSKKNTDVVDKLYTKLLGKFAKAGLSQEEKIQQIKEKFASMTFDEGVLERTIGVRAKNMTPQVALTTTKKLLKVFNQQTDEDDRDHLANQIFLGPEDFIEDRVRMSRALLNRALWKASTHGKLDTIPPNLFGQVIDEVLTSSGLGANLEETNPLEILDQLGRVSRLGPGGIGSIDAIPEESRNVHTSHLGYIDLVKTPESLKAGVDARLAYQVKKGSDGKLYAPFTDPKTRNIVYLSPDQVYSLTLAFPQEMENDDTHVNAIRAGKIVYVPKSEVNYILPDAEKWFSPITNMIAGLSADKGQRASMGSRFLLQAVEQINREAPLVRPLMPGTNKSFISEYGARAGAVFAEDSPGVVTEVTDNLIKVRYDNGQEKSYTIYKDFPFNRKTYIHNIPQVKPGDRIKPRQVLASSNFTDKDGNVALGMNVRVVYMPFKGLNYEDAYVVSQSYARRSASTHMYQHKLEFDENFRKGKKNYTAIFPARFTSEVLKKLDDDGVIKVGQTVSEGEPLILAARAREITHKDVQSKHKGNFVDSSVVWEKSSPGIVTDVYKTDNGVSVIVKSVHETKVGDKISGLHGDKGVIAAIIPDDEMPRDARTGEIYDIIANPQGMITRTNPGQLIEGWLGKVAQKTGKPIYIKNFDASRDFVEFVAQKLKEAGLSETDEVYDPYTGKTLQAASGIRYFVKLLHMAEPKHHGRGLGAYTAEDTPARGGEEGAKRLAMMDVNALLSHGATEVLRDAKLVRGRKNHEYWSIFMSGVKPPTPGTPLVYEKFINSLKAAGVNVIRNGSKLHLAAMTDKDVTHLAETRELTNAETVDWRDGLKPIKGGLFDPSLTGGHGGTKWSYIKLHEPFPNPVMEEPILRLLGLTRQRFRNILVGRENLGELTGPQAIHQALKNINVEREIARARQEIKTGRADERDDAIRRLGYLKACLKTNIHPADWMITKVPVLPPLFRPLSQLQANKAQIVADANFLYKELFDTNSNLKELSQHVTDLTEERGAVYDALKAVVGLGDPVKAKTRDKNIKGLLAKIFGDSSKYGFVQQKLLGTSLDLVGRAVVVPNPDLHIDEIGIPEARAWEVYSPFIIRRLVQKGMGRLQAIEAVDKRNEFARRALLEEMQSRPVMVNRAPVLHRFGRMAFFPKLVKGNVLHVSPLVVVGFGMDFDGDASNYEVPATDEAAREAVMKMLPSRNLFSLADFKKPMFVPIREYQAGLYAATQAKPNDKKERVFSTRADFLRAYYNGELDHGDPVVILNDSRKVDKNASDDQSRFVAFGD